MRRKNEISIRERNRESEDEREKKSRRRTRVLKKIKWRKLPRKTFRE